MFRDNTAVPALDDLMAAGERQKGADRIRTDVGKALRAPGLGILNREAAGF